jgi:hypothetical protein
MIYPDFLELLRVLEKHKVAYALIGGYAVGVHSEPRYTKDLDIIVAPTSRNATLVLRALEDFGAPIANLTREDLMKPGLLYVFGIPPLRVDILNRLKGVDVTTIIKRSQRIKVADTVLRVVRLDDLIRIKTISGSPQDRADVEPISKVSSSRGRRDRERDKEDEQTNRRCILRDTLRIFL